MFNPYNHMKDKYKKEFCDKLHFNEMFQDRLSMFDWTGLPDTIRPDILESILATNGTAPIFKYRGELYTGVGGYSGDVVNFLPQNYQCTNTGVTDFEGVVGKDIAVCWNNLTHTPDSLLMLFSSILAEIDVSERVNVIFSRFLRIPKAKNNKEKAALEAAINAIVQGRIEAVVSDDIQQILKDQDVSNQFLDLVDVKEVDKLQYLNQYRDNVLKRFYQRYGQGMQTTAKLAQQSVEELHGSDTVAMILPEQMLKCRQEFCDTVNSMYATDISVKFSKCWEDAEEQMEEMNTDGTPEDTPDTEPESEPKGGDDNE